MIDYKHGVAGRMAWAVKYGILRSRTLVVRMSLMIWIQIYLEKNCQNCAKNLMIDEDDMQSFNHLPVIKHGNWKFPINEGFNGKFISRWWVFNCHV